MVGEVGLTTGTSKLLHSVKGIIQNLSKSQNDCFRTKFYHFKLFNTFWENFVNSKNWPVHKKNYQYTQLSLFIPDTLIFNIAIVFIIFP